MQRGHPLGMPVGLRQAGVDQQTVAVLHRPCPMKHSFVALPLPLRYSLASGSVVEAWVSFERFWPWKVRIGIAAAALRRRFAGAVLRLDTLHRGPGLDQRTIDREVITR